MQILRKKSFKPNPQNIRKIVQPSKTGVHLNIRAGPTFPVLVWTVPPIYNY